jgi:DNA-binding NtrC family response regulator
MGRQVAATDGKESDWIMSNKSTILVVDSNRSTLELLSQQLRQEGYETLTAASLEELDQAVHGEQRIALCIIDISGFARGIWEHCQELHKAKMPFIVISPQRSPSVQRDSMKHGASGVLIKPLESKDLLEYIHTVLGD